MKYKFLPLLFAGSLLAACGGSTEGVEVDATDAVEGAAPVGQATVYNVSPAESMVLWTGSKLVGGDHKGTINVTEGRLAVQGDAITAGDFVIDMTSLTVTDLDEANGKLKLEGHLKNEDFFQVDQHPMAKFTITSVEAVAGDATTTHRLTGNLEMKGVSKSITIPANVQVTDTEITATTPAFEIDRNDWGVKYGSGSIAGIAQDNIINDDVVLVINLKAAKG